MNMFRHNRNYMDFDVVPFRNFANTSFAKIFVLELCKHLVTIFRYPFKMPKVYSNLMVVMFQFNVYKFHFRLPPATKIFTAHANQNVRKTLRRKCKAIPLQTKVCGVSLPSQMRIAEFQEFLRKEKIDFALFA